MPALSRVAPFHLASSSERFQTLSSIAAEKNSTIIFPVPIDFISGFISGGKKGNGGGGGAGAGSSPSATVDADTIKKEK